MHAKGFFLLWLKGGGFLIFGLFAYLFKHNLDLTITTNFTDTACNCTMYNCTSLIKLWFWDWTNFWVYLLVFWNVQYSLQSFSKNESLLLAPYPNMFLVRETKSIQQ